jgi:hypothetical protein
MNGNSQTIHGGIDMAPRKTKAKKVAKKKVVKKKVARKVRCIGKTKEGKRCKRITASPTKKCHLHRRQR